MIVLSLVLLAVSAVLLVVGIFQGSDGTAFLITSIAVTLAAAALLYAGVRNRTAAAAGTPAGGGDIGPAKGAGTVAAAAAATPAPPAQRPAGAAPTVASPPAQGQQPQRASVGTGGTASADTASQGPVEDPPGEPGIEKVSLGELARIAGREDEVVVVDGRPRYHVRSCSHLADRESEGLPVSEASELGFTPCATCAPVAALLARSGR